MNADLADIRRSDFSLLKSARIRQISVHPRSMISLVSFHPPAAVDALVAEVFGDCLAADFADVYAG